MDRRDGRGGLEGNGFFDDSGTVRSVANQSLDPTSIVGSDGKSSKCLGGSLGGFCKDLGV